MGDKEIKLLKKVFLEAIEEPGNEEVVNEVARYIRILMAYEGTVIDEDVMKSAKKAWVGLLELMVEPMHDYFAPTPMKKEPKTDLSLDLFR